MRGSVAHDSLEPLRSHVRAAAARTAHVLPWRVETVAGFVAAATALIALAYRIAVNAPVAVPAWLWPGVDTLALVGPAAAAIVLAVSTDGTVERVGLSFVGVFGLLAAFEPAALVPATGAVAGGGLLTVGARLSVPQCYRDWRRVAVAAVALAGLLATLGGAVDVAAVAGRPLGSTLSVAAVAATPVFVTTDWLDLTIGGGVAVLAFAVGASAPFVTGAVTLVAGGLVGTPLWLVALAIGGAATAISAAGRARDPIRACGVGLVFAGGVPVTVARALAVVLGLSMLVGGASE